MMNKIEIEKYLLIILVILFGFIFFDKTFQTILDYFFGEGKKYATDASKETIREYTHIITSSISFLIGYFVKGKIDNAEIKFLQEKLNKENANLSND